MIINRRPRTKGRPRMTRRGRAYTPKDTLKFEELVGEEYERKTRRKKRHETPVRMEIVLDSDSFEVHITPMPSSKRPKWVTGDLDNYAKAISDALNGIAYDDDRLVHELIVRLKTND